MKLPKILVLCSGGMDSTTALALTINQVGRENTTMMTFDYGSTHATKEMGSAWAIAKYFNVHQQKVLLPSKIFKGGGSALMGDSEIPKAQYQDPLREGPSSTVVPFRNAVLLSVATAYAQTHGISGIVFSAHATDYDRWAYPDCSPEFVGAMTAAIYAGTMGKVRLQSPFLALTKAGIVAIAADIAAPLELTWSCYRSNPLHCGECPTCIERIKAFHAAGYHDPVDYTDDRDFDFPHKDLKEFPDVPNK